LIWEPNTFYNKITLYGSLLDVGFIRYKQNADGLKAKGIFYLTDGIFNPILKGRFGY
jgi:hypothetical protein